MKRISIAFVFSLLFGVVFAEPAYNDFLSRKATLNLLVDSLPKTTAEVQKLIEQLHIKVDQIDINNRSKESNYRFLTDSESLESILRELELLGTIDLKKIETTNNISLIGTNEYELAYLEKQRALYEKELASLDKKANPEMYQELFEKQRELDKRIYEMTTARMKMTDEVSYSEIMLRISEKTVQYLDDRDEFSNFVNMPGVETFYYRLENPEIAFSHDQYMGLALRYMFTRGKSFFTIGILKPIEGNTTAISGTANDIVTWSIGKDFYPRYLGQGRRTWFNPYSGFQFGGMVLTSEVNIDHVFTVEPHIGLEIFKNKYVIFDIRAGYLFPLDEEKVKTFRGLTQNITFNVVF
jgi:hypothetical protein